MPEGPSIVIVKESVAKFEGKKIISLSGNSKIDHHKLLNQNIIGFKSWGKHFLICFNEFTLRVHFLLFGSYRIDDKKPDKPVRLNMTFKVGEINFYACSIKLLEGDLKQYYDWSADVMSDQWDRNKAKLKLKESSTRLVCDALLDQNIFSGVGNIIKNEILYRVRVHPESITGKIPSSIINQLVDETRIYSFQFLEWKKKFELKKHWLAHTIKICLRCNLPLIKKNTGDNKRRSFTCTNCQILYI